MERVPPPEWLYTPEMVEEACRFFISRGAGGVGFDTETTGVHTQALPILVQFSDGAERRVAMPAELSHCQAVYDLLQDERIPKVGTNIKRDMHWVANIGHKVCGPIECTLSLDMYYNENRLNMHGLKETSRDYLELLMKDFNEVFPKKVPGIKGVASTEQRIRYVVYQQCPGEVEPGADVRFHDAMEYATKDPYASMRVRNYLKGCLAEGWATANYTLAELFDAVERPFLQVLWSMERRGFMLHTGALKAKKPGIQAIKDSVMSEITAAAGWTVNLNSPAQVGKLLYDQLNLPILERTETGAPATGEEVMLKLAAKGSEIPKKILAYRSVSKTESTYIDGLCEHAWSDLRLHCVINAHIAVTGRLTTSAPSLMNIPRSSDDDYGIRECFIASPGKRLVVADYDQLEMKLIAHLSQDAGMIRAILEGKDLHCNTAALMAGVDYEEILDAKIAKDEKREITTRQQEFLKLRQAAKTVGFGILYGASASRIAAELKQRKEEAEELIRVYFRALPGVEAHIQRVHQEARDTGYVRTLLGRRRRLPNIRMVGNDRNSKMLRQEAERMAQNLGPQGGGADIMRLVMNNVERDPEMLSIGAEMLLQIHDELVLETPDTPDSVTRTKKRLKELMENPGIPLSVPLTASCNSGYSWASAK